MAEFSKFAALVQKQFAEMSKGELFVVSANPDDVYAQYLESFPEGTNPTFRERTEHDCTLCRHFIRNIGNVVSIKDNKIVTVWDVKGAEEEYGVVAAALAAYVKSKPIASLFRTEEKFRSFGKEYSAEVKEGVSRRWYHFHGVVTNAHVVGAVGKVTGEYATSVQVFQRGLEELNNDAFQTVIDLIDAKALYRGEEHLKALQAFQKVQREYLALKNDDRNTFLWTNANNPSARFRNTAIGTLIQDLSEGKDVEPAVKSFETKVAPENYKRTTAIITPAMIKKAMETLEAEGLKDAVYRRHARIDDISVNNVEWVAGDVQSKMKDGLEGLLLAAAAKQSPVTNAKGEDITMDDFMKSVLPRVKGMEILIKNSQQNKFVSVTAPKYADSGSLFNWGNDFGWSYDGEVTDSLRQKVQDLGGRVDGVLRFTHSWNHDARNASLMDLHVFLPGSGRHTDGQHNEYPSGPRVGWNNRNDRKSGGKQDVDYTDAAPEGYIPVENITFPSMERLTEGTFVFKIHNWSFRAPTKGGFRAQIELNDGQVFDYDHPDPLKHHQWITVAEATLKKGVFTIDHKIKPGANSREKWGVNTETFVKVNTLMMSPNFWDGKTVGNKHWFFIIDGCKNPNPTRGLYNEYLSPKLHEHRKVFEVLAAQTKCEPTDDQLSGVGFSSTNNDTVVVRVTGDKMNKTYNIKF